MARSLSEILSGEVRSDIEDSIGEAVVSSIRVIVNRQGKYSGQLRASNNVGLDASDLSVITVVNYERDAISSTRGLAVSSAERAVRGFQLGQDVFISNNHEYAVDDEVRPGRLAYASAAGMFPTTLRTAIASK